MRAHIIHDPPSDTVEIYVTHMNRYLSAGNKWVAYDPGTRPEMFARFDMPVWDAILREAMGTRTEDAETLKDTRMIRDRLLTMIEAEWTSRQLMKP